MSASVDIITPVQSYTFINSWREIADESHFWFKWRFAAALKQLKQLGVPLDAHWSVLDVGCGNGLVRKQFESVSNWNVDGADIDLQVLETAFHARGRTMYYDITTKSEGFKERYDAIILFDVLEHIADTPAFIDSLLFHLKVGGKLFVNVPAYQSLYSRFDEVVGHERRYTKKTLVGEFANDRLEIEDVRYWGFVNVPILALRKAWFSLFGKRMTQDDICKRGLEPPNDTINRSFEKWFQVETSFLSHPVIGSSLLLVAQKA